ncbi:MAG TPA: hypothetical protein VMT10_04760 [Solirubrobacteraceae bacterium]|nr:hypothetical protein [Solirubrobacteraceae bacterium]
MARVVAVASDLLFGSRIQAALAGAGHEVRLVPGEAQARAALPGTDVLVVDLAGDPQAGTALVAALRAEGALGTTRTLGCYSHVDTATRERAERAGFDLVVPRSRMNREGPELVARLAGA